MSGSSWTDSYGGLVPEETVLGPGGLEFHAQSRDEQLITVRESRRNLP
jgi:hypothetical protein